VQAHVEASQCLKDPSNIHNLEIRKGGLPPLNSAKFDIQVFDFPSELT
jgi:hypothetical protein